MPQDQLLARDLKTRAIVSVPPDMPVTAIARLLIERRISAVPVTDPAGRLLGLVSEADLLRRIAAAEDKPAGWFGTLFGNLDVAAITYARTHGQTAADIMTRTVTTVPAEATAARCAALMEEGGIKRLPVVSDSGELQGIVSRHDLLCAALDPEQRPGTGQPDSQAGGDAAIRARLRREMHDHSWADSYFTFTKVEQGVVTLHGYIRSEATRRGLLAMARRIDGVREVEDHTQLMPQMVVGGMV